LDYLKKLKIPFSCEFAGDFKDPAFEQQFKQRVRQYQLEDSIRLLGFCDREQLRAMFDRSNVLVMPSIFEEPFGKVQIEAQAAGLAVVRSPVGGYKDMLEDGVNGLLFKSEDAKDLARQLFVLRGDPSLWARIALQGQHDAFRFKTQASVETLEALFEGLIAKRMTAQLSGA
jgi:glycosyltransferase involved in cell wall biosynthesis